MPLLGYRDALPSPPRRILVAGVSGSGKTTLARQLAAALGIASVELDELHWGPQWMIRDTFLDDVRRFSAAPSWVCEWQYALARAILIERADTLVWLDHRTRTVMFRLVCRTLRRRSRGTELWHGNMEPSTWTLFTNRDHIVRWAWRTHPKTAQRVHDLLAGPDRDRLTIVRLRGPRDTRRWLHGPLALAGGSGPGTDNEEER